MAVTTQDIRRIIGLHGAGLPVVSLYVQIPVDPAERGGLEGRVNSLLADVRKLAADKSIAHDARMSLRNDLQRIEQAFRADGWPSTRSVAVFACSGRDLFEELPLPRAVREQVVLDETAFVRPALAVLDEYRRCCVVLIDSSVTQVWELYQDDLREVRTVKDEALRDPDTPWFTEYAKHNRARDLEKRHYRRTLQLLDELFRATPYDVLVIGGQTQEVAGFVEVLPPGLQQRVAGTFAVNHSSATRAEIKEHAAAILADYEREAERQLVGRVLDAAGAGDRAVVGLDDCLWAGSVGAIDRLLIRSDATAPGAVCDASGWLGTAGDTCPICGQAVRKTPDVLEELVLAVIDEGGSVVHITQDTRLREELVAAELRFPLPPKPEE